MKLFKLEITRIEPLTIVAESFDDAQAVFIEHMLSGFAHMPDTSTAVSEWRPNPDDHNKSLLDLAASGQRGVAWQSDDTGTWAIA